MTIELYVLLVVLAAIATFFVLLSGTQGNIGGVSIGRRLGIVLSGLVLVLWGVIAINSFEVVVHSGGQEFEREIVEMAWIAVAGGAIATYSMFQATIEEIRATGGI